MLIKKFLIAATIVTRVSSYFDKMKIDQFMVQTSKKELKNPNPAAGTALISETKHRGLLVLTEKHRSKYWMQMSLVFREHNQTEFKHSKVLRIEFPFKYNETAYLETELTYSPTTKNKDFNISQNSLKFYEVGQSLHLGEGRRILEEAVLVSLKIGILNDSPGSKHPKIKLNSLEIAYSDGPLRHLIKVAWEDMDRRSPVSSLDSALFLAGALMVVFAPFFILLFYTITTDKRPQNMFFLGLIFFSSTPTLPLLSVLTLMGTLRSQDYTFLILLLTLFNFKFRFYPLLEVARMLVEITRKREYVYLLIVVLVTLLWYILLIFDFRNYFRAGLFFSFLILVDILSLHRSSSIKKNNPLLMWFLSMLTVIVHQTGVYLSFRTIYLTSNWEAPSLFNEYILPDLVVLVLMLVPFHLVFVRFSERRMSKPAHVKASESCEVYYLQSEAWMGVNRALMKKADKEYHLGSFSNVPSQRRNRSEGDKIQQENIIHPDQVYNLISCRPLQSKDYILTAIDHSRLSIRYMVNSRQNWVYFFKKKFGETKEYVFINNIWIKNQKRRTMIACYNTQSKSLNLVSLKRRKTLVNLSFNRGQHTSNHLEHASVDLVLQPAFKNLPLLIYKTTKSSYVYPANFQIVPKNHKKASRKGSYRCGRQRGSSFYKNRRTLDNITQKDFFYRERSSEVESVYFCDLVATKYVFFDSNDHQRFYINDCKYQSILVSRIEPDQRGLDPIASLDRITEKMFSSCRIDFFFFFNKDRLCLIIREKLYFVDFRKVLITRCVKLVGLRAPLLRGGVDPRDIFTSYWYDRARGRILFSMGVQVEGREDVRLFLTGRDSVSVNYVLSGGLKDNSLLKSHQKLKEETSSDSKRIKINQSLENGEVRSDEPGLKKCEIETVARTTIRQRISVERKNLWELGQDEGDGVDGREKVSNVDDVKISFELDGKNESNNLSDNNNLPL